MNWGGQKRSSSLQDCNRCTYYTVYTPFHMKNGFFPHKAFESWFFSFCYGRDYWMLSNKSFCRKDYGFVFLTFTTRSFNHSLIKLGRHSVLKHHCKPVVHCCDRNTRCQTLLYWNVCVISSEQMYEVSNCNLLSLFYNCGSLEGLLCKFALRR